MIIICSAKEKKSHKQVLKNTKVNTWWQHFYFWLTIPLTCQLLKFIFSIIRMLFSYLPFKTSVSVSPSPPACFEVMRYRFIDRTLTHTSVLWGRCKYRVFTNIYGMVSDGTADLFLWVIYAEVQSTPCGSFDKRLHVELIVLGDHQKM